MASVFPALEYLAQAPGKRLRPQLLQAAAHAIAPGAGGERCARAAEAIELIHTYSLVHDDLPAMDDDVMRRGRPTLHVAFDEPTAILVGDGLQARAFELIATDDGLSSGQRVELIACLARAAGFDGMVQGQSIDMNATGKRQTLEELRVMHGLKTGALITAALEMGAIAAGGSQAQRETLVSLGRKIGLAFQIKDDILDVRGDSATLGKTAGKDLADGKSTFVTLMGIDAAEAEAERLYEDALQLLSSWGEDAEPLRALLARMVRRDY